MILNGMLTVVKEWEAYWERPDTQMKIMPLPKWNSQISFCLYTKRYGKQKESWTLTVYTQPKYYYRHSFILKPELESDTADESVSAWLSKKGIGCLYHIGHGFFNFSLL